MSNVALPEVVQLWYSRVVAWVSAENENPLCHKHFWAGTCCVRSDVEQPVSSGYQRASKALGYTFEGFQSYN